MRARPQRPQEILRQEIAAAKASNLTQIVLSAEDLSLLSIEQWQTVFDSCTSAFDDLDQPEFLIAWTNRPEREWIVSGYSSMVMQGLNKPLPEVADALSMHLAHFKQKMRTLTALHPGLQVIKVEYSQSNLISDWLDAVFAGRDLGSKLNTEIRENPSPSTRQLEALRIKNLKFESRFDPTAPLNWPEWQSPRGMHRLRRIHSRTLRKTQRQLSKRIAKENTGLLPVEICAVFRDEAKYLAEWVQFHLDEGVIRFHLFDDASADNYAEALEPFVSAGVVTVEPAKGRHQIEIYNYFLSQNKGRRAWVAFIDIDEFLFAPLGAPLSTALQRFAKTAGVFVFWKVFGSGGRQSASGKGVISDCTLRHEVAESLEEAVAQDKVFREIANGKFLTGRVDQGKSVVRLDRVDEMLIHCPKRSTRRMVDTRGRRFSRAKWASVRRHRKYLPNHEHLLIHHYWARNLDALIMKHQREKISLEQRESPQFRASVQQALTWDERLSTRTDTSLRDRVRVRQQPYIFVIGFNKTATRAFEAYFNENGLPAAHWEQNRLTDKMLDNLDLGRRILDGYDTVYRVFSDMISSTHKGSFEGNQYFRELDRDYPNSFFILNNRDTEDWIQSREQHGQGAFLRRELNLLGANDLPRLKQLWRSSKFSHETSVREYFQGNPRFAEIDIDSADVPQQINRLVGIGLDVSKWRIVGKTTTS